MRSVANLCKLVFLEIFRRKDFYVAFVLIFVIVFYASRLNFYNVENIVRYLREIGLAMIFLSSVLIIVPLAARQYPQESEHRTLLVLMAKPVSRFQFVCGKFLGSALAGIACFLIFYGVFVLITIPRSADLSWVLILQTGFLFCLSLLVLAAMASALSYVMTFPATVTLVWILYLLINTYGPGLNKIPQEAFWLSRYLANFFYYVFPHFEFFDMRQRLIHQWDPISGGLLLFLTVYALVYVAFFLLVGWLKFRRQRI